MAPVVAFLTHRDCPVSGEIYTVGAGHVARFFIGRTKGFYSPELSIEDVRDHLDEIRDEAGYTVPGGPADEMSELFATIMANRIKVDVGREASAAERDADALGRRHRPQAAERLDAGGG